MFRAFRNLLASFGSQRTNRRSPNRKTVLAVHRLEDRWAPAVNVLSFHGDIASTGVNPNETILTPANVNTDSFGKLFTTPLDGQVYAEPLVVTSLTIDQGPNKIGETGVHDVVFVATEHDSLYAIDADADAGGAILWQRRFTDLTPSYIGSDPETNINNTRGATAITIVPSSDTGK